MTQEELRKFKKPLPSAISKLPIKYVADHIEDKYGVYETGFYLYKGKQIFINKEDGLWHFSVATKHPIGYYELKEMRYKFMPNGMQVAQIFPPREDFVNLHENCYHLFELGIRVIEEDEEEKEEKSNTEENE